MAQQPRRRLVGLELTGWRRSLRAGSLWAVAALAGFTAFLHLVERHREDLSSNWGESSSSPDWGPAHSLAGETYFLPVLVPLVVLGAALWARRGFPRGLVPALLAPCAFFIEIVAWVNAHLFEDTSDPALTVGAILSCFFLACLGVWLLVVEIAVPFAERRRLEATDPVFPTARVV